MSDVPHNETRIRILDAAEEMFSKRGYSSVTLRDIADAVGMKHASLYYYFPRKQGKAHLFIEVMERNFLRHREGVAQAIEAAGDDLRAQMYAVADWYTTQPPIDLARMAQSDLIAVYEENRQEAQRIMRLVFDAMRLPMLPALERARAEGVLAIDDLGLAAIALVHLIQSVHNIPDEHAAIRQQISHSLVDMMLDGWLKR
jgi:AcrR family transcriptional regulator